MIVTKEIIKMFIEENEKDIKRKEGKLENCNDLNIHAILRTEIIELRSANNQLIIVLKTLLKEELKNG